MCAVAFISLDGKVWYLGAERRGSPLSVSSDSPLDRTLGKMGLESQQVVKDRSIG